MSPSKSATSYAKMIVIGGHTCIYLSKLFVLYHHTTCRLCRVLCKKKRFVELSSAQSYVSNVASAVTGDGVRLRILYKRSTEPESLIMLDGVVLGNTPSSTATATATATENVDEMLQTAINLVGVLIDNSNDFLNNYDGDDEDDDSDEEDDGIMVGD